MFSEIVDMRTDTHVSIDIDDIPVGQVFYGRIGNYGRMLLFKGGVPSCHVVVSLDQTVHYWENRHKLVVEEYEPVCASLVINKP